MQPKTLLSWVGKVKDWPKRGVTFYDLNPIMADEVMFNQVVDDLFSHVIHLVDEEVEFEDIKIAGIEARGFIWGAAVATKLGSSFIPIRKSGKIPTSTISGSANVRSEYAEFTIELPANTVKRGDVVVLIDDVLATGQTALGAVNMLTWAGAKVAGACFVLKLDKLDGRVVLGDLSVRSVLSV